jgi:hypothetical protein
MHDFLYSEISNFYSIPNIPDDPDLAIAAGTNLCETLLEPLSDTFGGIAIRSAYRSREVNEFGNKHKLNCSTSEQSYADHIWDQRDADGYMGATACIVVKWFLPEYEKTGDWRPLAWWIHDHLPYSEMNFFPKLAAFNLTWHEKPKKIIYSYAKPQKGYLTNPKMHNYGGNHSKYYQKFPKPKTHPWTDISMRDN